ncbi:SEC-C metal-binding domain-containing protein [Clostridium malenominatum]|uniref:SEC-C metal-binding domain-containing protein n=1 Tax=Clostridium malenominatum TaxID=1539 RepID=A0ABP3U8U1_9CLOT
MSLYNEWKELVVFFVQTRGEDEFWSELNRVQEKIIPAILKSYRTVMRGALKNLAKKLDVSEISFVGFLDGINSSLKKPIDLESVTENSRISLDIDFEKLYISLLEAEVDNLYNLPEWNLIFGKDKLTDLKLAYSEEKTITVSKIGRNDPCPCGSEKKYKNCCGKNL